MTLFLLVMFISMYLFEQIVGKKTKVERIINWRIPETMRIIKK